MWPPCLPWLGDHHAPNCVLNPAIKLFFRHMTFVGNVQKSPLASNLKGLCPSLEFCYKGPALTDIKECRSDECPHQLNLA